MMELRGKGEEVRQMGKDPRLFVTLQMIAVLQDTKAVIHSSLALIEARR
jgi:hypothetical protein